jgi:hypothetical protein
VFKSVSDKGWTTKSLFSKRIMRVLIKVPLMGLGEVGAAQYKLRGYNCFNTSEVEELFCYASSAVLDAHSPIVLCVAGILGARMGLRATTNALTGVSISRT